MSLRLVYLPKRKSMDLHHSFHIFHSDRFLVQIVPVKSRLLTLTFAIPVKNYLEKLKFFKVQFSILFPIRTRVLGSVL